jgi:hypothetical protein
MDNRVLLALNRIFDGLGGAMRTPSGVSPDRFFGFRHDAGRRGIFHGEDGRL